MKCQILFQAKNKKNISKSRLLKILPRVLSIKAYLTLKKTSLNISMWQFRYFLTFFKKTELDTSYKLLQQEMMHTKCQAA